MVRLQSFCRCFGFEARFPNRDGAGFGCAPVIAAVMPSVGYAQPARPAASREQSLMDTSQPQACITVHAFSLGRDLCAPQFPATPWREEIMVVAPPLTAQSAYLPSDPRSSFGSSVPLRRRAVRDAALLGLRPLSGTQPELRTSAGPDHPL